ncbi:amidohydrolase family protein [Schaalia sp. 19OD2882]|uniref:amidohydrolase family protein n=1 Tax=Schaalia sp. 19OD2882 TaxID=2794089 RepID=UPI001C1EA438|nr:amidohydrolase family protein [Schaalia sp. 19OD2882]QWW19604.1 amidohydrolase family protein [Schaalia sp. 19OD2882]
MPPTEHPLASPTPCQPLHVWSADLVIPVTAPSVLGGAVAVRDGRIEHVGSRDWVVATLRERGLPFEEVHVSGVLMPGLVNAHTHLQYTSMAGVGAGRYNGFPDWMQAFDLVYDAGGLDFHAAAADGAARLLRAGTTCAADVVTDPEAAGALHDAGLHGVAYWEVMGYSNEAWADGGLDQVRSALAAMPSPPAVGISPHAPYSLEVAPLLELPDLARRHGMRLHIHLGEDQVEARWDDIEAGAALADLWRSGKSESFRKMRDAGVGFSATEFVDQLGVLGPDCHIAHGVYMSAEDRRRLHARSTTVALCPRSNDVIGLAEPPVAAYLKEGNQVAVGTDSLSSSPSLDVLEDTALLFDIARRQGYEGDDLGRRLLHAATLGGAIALGLSTGSHRVGQLQAGALADVVAVDVPVTDIVPTIEHIIREGAGHQILTLVAGKVRWAAPELGLEIHP